MCGGIDVKNSELIRRKDETLTEYYVLTYEAKPTVSLHLARVRQHSQIGDDLRQALIRQT